MPLLQIAAIIVGLTLPQVRPAVSIVADIIKADYEADLPALLQLSRELDAAARTGPDASRLCYWRGFARWRRAINGANDGASIAQMREDLEAAEHEFGEALAIDPGFVDAKAALVSAIGIQLFFAGSDTSRAQPLIDRVRPLVKPLRLDDQVNPRMIWVLGQSYWRTPASWSLEQVRARQEGVIKEYQRGLDLARAQPPAPAATLEPRWGEPELLMSLAWSHLNQVSPDLEAAERFAREALRLVPHWHYVRDVLLPQILEARKR